MKEKLKKKSIDAIIFARGGSKGVPGKNIREISKKPLIAYSIELALDNKYINEVYVSTNDYDIAKISESYGAKIPFMRPPELSGDDSNEWLAWQHALRSLNDLNKMPEIMVSLPATSPLRSSIDIDLSIDSILSEDTISIGNGIDSLNFVVATEKNAHKSQFLYHADELAYLGLIDDTINAISLNILSNNEIANFLTIRIKHTNDTVLSNLTPHINDFIEVYNANTLLTNGINKFHFTEDFVWDSISNIIIEFSITNSTVGGTTLIEGAQTINNLGLFSNDANHITVNSSESIELPTTAMNNISDEVTVSFWINGNENVLPQNTTILEGYDANNYRTLNIHFPWSNGRMYWDCGNSGTSSYDRIDKAASLNEYTGGWSHWAFTKNANTGDLKIYRNGTLWHSGTGYTRTIDIESLRLASHANGSGYFWNGHIKEFRMFDKELSLTTINEWMYKRINSLHPDYSNLVAHYPFNEGQGITSLDNTNNQQIATFNGNVNWNYTRGNKINHFFTEVNYRPNINFYQGQYNITLSNDTVLDSLVTSGNMVTEYTIIPNHGTLLDDSIGIVSSNVYWESLSYLFDENGNVLSVDTVNIDGSIYINDLVYYKRYPMAFQIMSFVTPYGMGVNFGADGTTWYFDVTDFAPILQGNKQITMSGGGQWQEDIDLKFLFIVGTPTRDVLEMQQIWRPQSKGYSTIIANNAFEPRNVLMHPNADAYKIRTTITGHGQEGEFIPQNHTINIDGGAIDYTWPVWTECAENPIFPQGGTWIYDRAGWCPGQPSDNREDDITHLVAPGQIHNIDYGLVSATGSSNYWVSSQLVSYGDINFNTDASILEILSPTNNVLYSRQNPICSNPKITIQNTGSNPLTSLEIEYWINNAQNHEIFQWTGNLGFLEKETIELPANSSLWSSIDYSQAITIGDVTTYENGSNQNKFYAKINLANGNADDYSFNNMKHSTFTPPPEYPEKFVFWYSTNNGIIGGVSETSWEMTDDNGNIIYAGQNLNPNTQYIDTISLNQGCHVLNVVDTDDDGLEFWANNDGGGMLRFKRLQDFIDSSSIAMTIHKWIKTFELDFGSFIKHEFMVKGSILDVKDINTPLFNFYPNPTSNHIIITGTSNNNGNITILDKLGKIMHSETFGKGSLNTKINMENYAAGIYFIKLNSNNTEITKKVIRE